MKIKTITKLKSLIASSMAQAIKGISQIRYCRATFRSNTLEIDQVTNHGHNTNHININHFQLKIIYLKLDFTYQHHLLFSAVENLMQSQKFLV